MDPKPTFLENVDMMLNDAIRFTKIDKEISKWMTRYFDKTNDNSDNSE